MVLQKGTGRIDCALFQSEHDEAEAIADRIRSLAAPSAPALPSTGKQATWSDFAVLYRKNSQARQLVSPWPPGS